jgi:hypothetical protein
MVESGGPEWRVSQYGALASPLPPTNLLLLGQCDATVEFPRGVKGKH